MIAQNWYHVFIEPRLIKVFNVHLVSSGEWKYSVHGPVGIGEESVMEGSSLAMINLSVEAIHIFKSVGVNFYRRIIMNNVLLKNHNLLHHDL